VHNFVDDVCTICGALYCAHSDSTTAFEWQTDYSSAKIAVTCTSCGDVQMINCEISSQWDAENGTLTFTAAAEGGFTDVQTIKLTMAGGKLTITNSAAAENKTVDMIIMVAGYTGGQMTGCQVIEDVTGVTEVDLTVSGELKVFFLNPGTYAPLFVCAEL
jgi:hypothetical protein